MFPSTRRSDAMIRKFLASLLFLGWVAVASAQTTAPLGPAAGGSGGGGSGSGTVTSVATGCQANGGTITTTGTISTQDQWYALSGGAIVAADCGGTVDVSGSSDNVPTIAVAGSTGFPQWWYVYACSTGTHSQTITPGSGTIGGASTFVLAAGTVAAPACVKITSDAANTNYKVSFVPSSGSGNANFGTASGNTANNFVTMANTTTGVQDSGHSFASPAAIGSSTPAAGTFTTLGFLQPEETAVSLSGCNGSTATMNLTLGTYFYCTVSTGSTTFAVSNPASTGLVSSFTLELTNGGSQTLTWMSGTKWPGGSAPTLTSSGVDLIVCSTRDGATTWRCVGSEINSH